MDLHQKECPNCGDFIPFTRKILIFRPLPKTLICPTCGCPIETSYAYRSMAFFFWTMRNYMALGTAFMIVVVYVNMGYFDDSGLNYFPWFFITRGPIIIAICASICLLTSFTIQAVIDFFIQPGSK